MVRGYFTLRLTKSASENSTFPGRIDIGLVLLGDHHRRRREDAEVMELLEEFGLEALRASWRDGGRLGAGDAGGRHQDRHNQNEVEANRHGATLTQCEILGKR